MRDTHKELVIKTAIQEYKNSVLFGFSSSTAHAISMMEDAWHMCVAYNIKGIAELEKTIKEAKEKYKKELGDEEMMKDENMFEKFIHAFRNKYDYDEIDEKYFDNPLLVEKVNECIQDYEDEEIPAEIMAEVVYKTLYFLQYGDTLDSDDLQVIHDDLQDRFLDGR